MSDALEEHDGKVSIGGRNITSLRFTDAVAEEEQEQELQALVESLDKTCRKYQTDDKLRLWHSEREIKVKRKKLGTVKSFKYLGAVVSDVGSKP